MNDGEAGTSRCAVVTEDYDVFLNHRGPDVKATFVAHLEDALRCAGHRPFLDARSLMKGNSALQSIDHALATANVHVAVVSTGYAESKYCLNELVAMLRSGKPVVPVFYGVEPVDLRWVENGPFAAAFARHQSKRRSQEKVQEWRDALAALAEITGFRLADYRGDESKLKREVVNQVARLTPSHIPVEVDSCRVGLEDSTRSCIQVMEEMGGGIGILGIVGMGGIGKTTLAREIFNYYASESKFKHMSFLEIHRESFPSASSVQGWPAWALPLRKQLMWDLLHVDSSGSMDYKSWFLKVYTVGPVMIVVDNVYSLEQLNALIPIPAGLHPGSRIVVTSRDWSILKNVVGRVGVEHFIFDVPLLDSYYSSMLFNWHAFNSMEAKEELEGFAKDIVEACGGLPLALKVSGSSLFDKRMGEDREAIWIEARDAMKRSRDVMDVLRWSYDILPKADQRMFLDLACLFNNKTREEALAYWRSCKDCVSCDGMGTPHTSLRNLIDKNLVSCNYDNKWLKVHDLLVELGEEIGRMAKTHFTKGNTGEVALTRKEGLTKTLALNLRESRKRRFEVEEFANMPNLHFLELPKKAKIDGDWRCMPRELRWLRWRNTTLKQVPQDFYLSKLTYLDFSCSSKLVDLWSNSNCSLKGCPNLVQLNLSKCSSIKELPDSIGQSLQLQVLYLESCTSLRKLPDTIGELKQLQWLTLAACKRLKTLPESFGQASHLQQLSLEACERLERLPESFGLLKELQLLSMINCTSLKTLPSSVGTLSKLRSMCARGCISLRSIPPSLLLCSSLGTLELQMDPCSDLQTGFADSIPEASTELRSLKLRDTHGLISYLPYGAFKSLRDFFVWDKTLTEFPESIGLLETLDSFHIECEMLEYLPNSLGDLKFLTTLSLGSCKNLKRLPKTLGTLTNLRFLYIRDCTLLRKLPSSIGMLSRLTCLHLYGCKKLKKLSTSFQQLKILKEFALVDCENIEVMEVLSTLQGMPIWGSTFVTKLPPSLGVLSNLHIRWSQREYASSSQPFDGTYQVLEEGETGILKAYQNESTGLLTLEVCFYYRFPMDEFGMSFFKNLYPFSLSWRI